MDCTKIIVIRRDNIGDLVCTTPLFAALRRRYPDARIDALVNSYNQPVLADNPDLDHVYAYTKAKHRLADGSLFGIYWNRLKMLGELRAVRYDLAILANDGDVPRAAKLARWIRPRHLLGFVKDDGKTHSIDLPVRRPASACHAVEVSLGLLTALGFDSPGPNHLVLRPEAEYRAHAAKHLASTGWYQRERPLVAIHISARKVPQRWPIERFAELMRRLHAAYGAQFVLFWSPGDENNPLHPGDDRKALALQAACSDLPLCAFPTTRLEELIAGISLCDSIVCSDGGAMHIAAALGKPLVCLFGNSDAARWHPWGVPFKLLQKPSRNVEDIAVDEVFLSWSELRQSTISAKG